MNDSARHRSRDRSIERHRGSICSFVPYNEFGASVLNNIILLFVCLLVGMLLRVTHRIPDNTHNALNAFIIHISLPALIVLQIHNVTLHAELLLSVAMPWVMFLLGVGFFWVLSARLELSRGTTGALMLAGGLANTSFVGLPMIEAFFGAPSMATGILIDQLGTYLVLSTLGIAVAAIYSSGSNSMVAVLKRIAVFPPLLALIVAFGLMPFEFPGYVTDALKRLGDTLAPLALVSVGLQLRFDQTRGIKTALALGLAFKLLLAPAVLALLYFSFARTGDDVARVTLFEAAMGPQIGGAIVAFQHGLNPPLVSLMVGVGITLSFITLPLWSQLLHQL
jgi:malate permease and related proteins